MMLTATYLVESG